MMQFTSKVEAYTIVLALLIQSAHKVRHAAVPPHPDSMSTFGYPIWSKPTRHVG